MKKQRLARLRELLQAQDLDAFIIFSAESGNRAAIQYLSGFTGSTAVLLITRSRQFIIVDSRYFIQAEEESGFTLARVRDRDPWPTIEELIADSNIKSMGFEEDRLTVANYQQLTAKVERVQGIAGVLPKLRESKDSEEIELLRESCRIASEAFIAFMPKIRPGRTEAQLAADLAYEVRRQGAQQMVRGHFVVASGRRGERPHGVFTDKQIETGDFITFDFGAVYRGYISDITRTVAVGSISAEMEKIYGIVYEAQQKAIAAAKAGMTGAELDRVARTLIEDAGYGRYFTHSLGHGIGLELHELPNLNRYNTTPLPCGCVVSIEPGIYLPGKGGVRIEDDVLLTEAGCEVLSFAPKELIVL
jgi:Xaa-Pro aminopeptidase